nr:MAG TPA: hypothetical protein [Caudoviricetes sp.]
MNKLVQTIPQKGSRNVIDTHSKTVWLIKLRYSRRIQKCVIIV